MLKAPIPSDHPASGVLIGRRGKVWPARSGELASRLRFARAEGDLAGFAVRERGFIHLLCRADGIHVRLRKRKFTQCALLGALLTLETYPARVLLSIHDGRNWSHKMFTDLGSFAEYAETVAADKPFGARGAGRESVPGFSAEQGCDLAQFAAESESLLDLPLSSHRRA